MANEFVSLEQLRLMEERVLFAKQSNATLKLKNLLYKIREANVYKPVKMLIVGAGGSFSSALLVKQMLEEGYGTSEIDAVTPQTAIRKLTQFPSIIDGNYKVFHNVVIAISYSGKTPDIQKVYEVCKKVGIEFILITKAKPSDLSEIYSNTDNIISYYNKNDYTGNERGMISMAATLSPVVIFDDLDENSKNDFQKYFEDGKRFVEKLDISSIAASLKKAPVVNLFFDWDTMPTAYDIESKLTESGIANVILHEKKNFSHGRYVSLYTLKSGLNIDLLRLTSAKNKFVLDVESDKIGYNFMTGYDTQLSKFLSEMSIKNDVPFINIDDTSWFRADWNFKVMMMIPYLITSIGEKLGVDISKPLKPFPEEPKALFNYKGNF